jgi:hypothetical protein
MNEVDEIVEQELEVARALDRIMEKAQMYARRLDTRTTDEMYRPLPVGHPAARLRFLAYRMKLAREALL